MKLLHLVVLFVAVYAAYADDQDDENLNAPQMIVKYGYECEIHYVTTKDGYILQMHRIPRKNNNTASNGKVVYLQHGLLSSSVDWIITGPSQALAYLLADEGYDVWLGNNRGNTYSRNHTTLDPNKSEFWNYSWHEIALNDISAMIDHILNVTGQEKIFHIGHSQGTTTYYILTSTYPEYNDKIIAHFSLAPIGFMNHAGCPFLGLIAPFVDVLDVMGGLIGFDEFLPSNELMKTLGDLVCADDDISQVLCSNILFLIVGFSPSEMNSTLLPSLMAHTPAGSSRHQFVHYGQEYNSGHFRQFDHLLNNMIIYGQLFPPEYELGKITSDIYLIYSDNDWMSSIKDVERLYEAIPSVKAKILVADYSFNHLDYMFGIHARTYVYNEVVSLMARYK